MKTFLTLSFLAAALAAPVAHSDEAHHPEGASGEAPRTAPAPRADEKSMKRMQEDYMARMRKTTDPVERQRLMDDHMESLPEGMPMMRGMGGGMMHGMVGGGMTGGAPKDGAGKGAVRPPGSMAHHDMMETRMDMMQMMEHMMQHHQTMQGVPAK